MKYAILGGGGCFGLNLARYLLARGHEAVGIGRSHLRGDAFTLGTDKMGYRYHVYSVGPDNQFIAEILEEERPQVIVNFAAQGEGAASFKARNWRYFVETNALAMVDLAERLLGRPWLERFIQVGTSELYGSAIHGPVREDAPLNPSSVYAASKAAFDMAIVAIARSHAFPGIVVRPSNCFTPGQQLHRIVPKAFLLGLTGRKLPLHGGGHQRKSYMDADDLSAAIELLARRGVVGEIYNAGPEEPISVRNVVALCARAMEVAFDQLVDEAEDRTGQDSCYWIDSTKLRSLGWEPRVSLDAGIGAVGAWVWQYLETLKCQPTDFRMRA